jgi:hypothetical protein
MLSPYDLLMPYSVAVEYCMKLADDVNVNDDTAAVCDHSQAHRPAAAAVALFSVIESTLTDLKVDPA